VFQQRDQQGASPVLYKATITPGNKTTSACVAIFSISQLFSALYLVATTMPADWDKCISKHVAMM